MPDRGWANYRAMGYATFSFMSNITLPPTIAAFFVAKDAMQLDSILACFAENATVYDNGEDVVLEGIERIGDWMRNSVSRYRLSSEVTSAEMRGGELVANVVVSGDFPGSPYEFTYRFKMQDDRIAELAIDPIGSLAQ